MLLGSGWVLALRVVALRLSILLGLAPLWLLLGSRVTGRWCPALLPWRIALLQGQGCLQQWQQEDEQHSGGPASTNALLAHCNTEGC